LRGPPPAFVRQPDLGSPPAVSAATGLGPGGGAYVRNHGSGADQSQGVVVVQVGTPPAASGTINLLFPIAPAAGQYWTAADWATLTPTIAGNQLQLAWAATRTLVAGERLLLPYQWTVSQ
jgi:hypothetical protein